ncbi:hypothetical protein [Oenococcus sp.]|uniref:hypothetical protein n=1 Tax=Oenococcus sp. TaxID=1979414 RepID=UPI0039EA1F45
MKNEYGPYNMLNLTQAFHEFWDRDKSRKVTPEFRAWIYQIRHIRVGKIIKWQWKDIQDFIERNKRDEIAEALQ